jgi:hypothetical protein
MLKIEIEIYLKLRYIKICPPKLNTPFAPTHKGTNYDLLQLALPNYHFVPSSTPSQIFVLGKKLRETIGLYAP